MAGGGIPMDVWSGANATNALHETIKTQIVAMDRQSKAIACLTKIMLVLAVVRGCKEFCVD